MHRKKLNDMKGFMLNKKNLILLTAIFLVFLTTLSSVKADILVKIPEPIEVNLELRNLGKEYLSDWYFQVEFWKVDEPSRKVRTTLFRFGGGDCEYDGPKMDCGCKAWKKGIAPEEFLVITCWVPSEYFDKGDVSFQTGIWNQHPYLKPPYADYVPLYLETSIETIIIEDPDYCDEYTPCPQPECEPYLCSENKCEILMRKKNYQCNLVEQKCEFTGYDDIGCVDNKIPNGMVCNVFNPITPILPFYGPWGGYGCGVDLSECVTGECTGNVYYQACDGSGSCSNNKAIAAKKTVYAVEGYTLQPTSNDCELIGSKECDTSTEKVCIGDCQYGLYALKCSADHVCSYVDYDDISNPPYENVPDTQKCENGVLLYKSCAVSEWECSGKSKVRTPSYCSQSTGSCVASPTETETIICGSDDPATDSDGDDPSVLGVCYGGVERGCDDANSVEQGRCYANHVDCYGGCTDECFFYDAVHGGYLKEYITADINPANRGSTDAVKESCDSKPYKLDTTQGACNLCVGAGHYRSDIIYEAGSGNCCGDDKREYLITTNGKTACCDKPSDCVNNNDCQDGIENYLTTGTCSDGRDNDCDGLPDTLDPECNFGYNLLNDGEWCPEDHLCNSSKCDRGDLFICFECAACSGVERCSNQELDEFNQPIECESQCGADAKCDDLQVDECYNLNDDDSFYGLTDEYCGDCGYDGCGDNCCYESCKNIGDCIEGANTCTGSHCRGSSCECCLDHGADCGSDGCSPVCCNSIKRSMDGSSYGCCGESECWTGSTCISSGIPNGQWLCDWGRWRICSESTVCNEYADNYCAWNGATYGWQPGSSHQQKCAVCKACGGTADYNEEDAPICSKPVTNDVTYGCDGNKYCCGGLCVDPGPTAGLGLPCGGTGCGGGNWICDGTDYKCSTKDEDCYYCDQLINDIGHKSSCNKDGECEGGSTIFGLACKMCVSGGKSLTWNIDAYNDNEDTEGLSTCSGSCNYCYGGECRTVTCNPDDKGGIQCVGDNNDFICDGSGDCVAKYQEGGHECRVTGCGYSSQFCESGVCCSDYKCKGPRNGCCVQQDCIDQFGGSATDWVCNEDKQCEKTSCLVTQCWDGAGCVGDGTVDNPYICDSGTWRFCTHSTVCDEYAGHYCSKGLTWEFGMSEAPGITCGLCKMCTGNNIGDERAFPECSMVADPGTSCGGSNQFCCGGSCVTIDPSVPLYNTGHGGACGSGDCTDTWACDGTNYKCSSMISDCSYCVSNEDIGYTSKCDRNGQCSGGTATICPACTECVDSNPTTIICNALDSDTSQVEDTVGANKCSGLNKYCCGGSCVTTPGGDWGQVCAPGTACESTWKCDGTNYDCSKDVDCSYCIGDSRFMSTCTREGVCPAGAEDPCDPCQTCDNSVKPVGCKNAYSDGEDLNEPGICSGACEYCTSGSCQKKSCAVDPYGVTCIEDNVCNSGGNCVAKALPGESCNVNGCTGTPGSCMWCLNSADPTLTGTCCAPDPARGKNVNSCKGDCCTNANCLPLGDDYICNDQNFCERLSCEAACEEAMGKPSPPTGAFSTCRETITGCNIDEVDVTTLVTVTGCTADRPRCCCAYPCTKTNPGFYCAFDACGYDATSECGWTLGDYKQVYVEAIRPLEDMSFQAEYYKVHCYKLNRNVEVTLTPLSPTADFDLSVIWESSGNWVETEADPNCPVTPGGKGVAETCSKDNIGTYKWTLIAVSVGSQGIEEGDKYTLTVNCGHF